MVIDFKHLRPPANYPTYPPYHSGDYTGKEIYNRYFTLDSTCNQILKILSKNNE